MSGERHDSPAARELPTVTGIRVLARRTVVLQIDGAADVTITPEDRAYLLPAPLPGVLTVYLGESPAQQFQLPDHLAPVLEHSLRWNASDLNRLSATASYVFLVDIVQGEDGAALAFLSPDGSTFTELVTSNVTPFIWAKDGSYVRFDFGPHTVTFNAETQATFETPERTVFALTAPDVLKDVLALWGIDFRQPEEVQSFRWAA